MARRSSSRRRPPVDAEAILDEALAEAGRVGWHGLRLHRVAARLGQPLSELYRHYRDADAIAEAWLSRADRAMLSAAAVPGLARRKPRDRLERTLLAWLDALAEHRAVTAQMLLGKLYPGHPHHLAGLVFRLSRTVQWWREAAGLDAGPPRRQLEEIALTTLFAATVACWGADRSPGQAVTRTFVTRALGAADTLAGRLFAAQDGSDASSRR
jgi:AcrR family transcriptional regulator